METLRRTPFPRALHRPNLLLGGERRLVIITAALALGLFLSDISLLKGILALVSWTMALAVLRLMAKIDPQLSQIYLRYLKYRKFYPAQSRAWGR